LRCLTSSDDGEDESDERERGQCDRWAALPV